MNYKFGVQEKKRLRVIVDTDAACEADDQYAIVHALLTPRFIIKGIIAEQFGGKSGERTVKKSYQEIQKILSLMDMKDVPVYYGAEYPLSSEQEIPESEGADIIIKEALSSEEDKLYVLCQGAITNVAIALNKCPEIVDQIICIWIGGGFYPEGGWEFNLLNDYHAANVVFKSKIELWQVPMDCYTRMQVGYAELQRKVMPCGAIGKYLFDEMQELGMKADWICGEAWSLGDSPAIGLALNPGCGHCEIRKAPIVDSDGYYIGNVESHDIRVFYEIDSRYILEDFFAKLAIYNTGNIKNIDRTYNIDMTYNTVINGKSYDSNNTDKTDCLLLARKLLEMYEISRKQGILAIVDEARTSKYQSKLLNIAIHLMTSGLSIEQIDEILERYAIADNYVGNKLLESQLIREGVACILDGADFNYMKELLCSYFGVNMRDRFLEFCNLDENIIFDNIISRYKDKEVLSNMTNLLEECLELDDRIYHEALIHIDNKTLCSALKGASGEVIRRLLSVLSPNLTYFISEDIENNDDNIDTIIMSQKEVRNAIERLR
ncbi:nucleoside hydrolase [Anaeromicropila herbilytica]|uniref:Nucleoside hydrolase n=1 Tax=Anaeromicropila herbilytica TaxID=2785025 RepID=A0A7R7ELC3_9FIRM|nr:nucleoside hydrolase [Anaeromicropila herbilytica]BCN30899.1 hypothetical protein bsdtb5_21940 [Anaeromicropila herbilytica]